MKKDLTFKATDNEKIKISTFIIESSFSGNALIFVHGFKGFKDWGFGPYLAETFAERGFFVVTFNFSHNGIGEIENEFTELEKFSRNTFSREIRELNEIIDALLNDFFNIGFKGKIGLIGHSRGGAISLLTASKRKEIDSLSIWASVSKLDRYSKRQKEKWKKEGFFDVMNMRTKQVMRLNVSLLEDIERNSNDLLNIEAAVKNLNRPLLIVHGDQDLAVPIKEAEEIYSWADKSKTEFFKIFGTGHTFDCVHPFSGTNEKLEKVIDKTSKFFNNNFKN